MSNIAAVETGPTFGASRAEAASRCGSLKVVTVTAPLPLGSRNHIFSDVMPKTLPLGATQARGYHHLLLSGPNASRLLAPNRLFHWVPSKSSGVIPVM